MQAASINAIGSEGVLYIEQIIVVHSARNESAFAGWQYFLMSENVNHEHSSLSSAQSAIDM